MTRTALVTGGLGFLGSRLVQLLAQEGTVVHVVDDRSAGRWRISPPGVWSAQHVIHETSVERYANDVLDGRLPRTSFNEIYHLASVVGPLGVLPHAGRIVPRVAADADLIARLAELAGARVVYASTSEIYGGDRDVRRSVPCAESDPRVVPAEPTARLEYAVAKLAAEISLVNATRAGRIEAVVVRPFNVAGPGQSAAGGFVLPRFVRQALTGVPLTVYDDGLAVRAFTHVDDVAEGVVRAARQGAPGRAYNLGRAENRTTIRALAELVIAATGSRSEIVHVDPRQLHGPAFAEAPDKIPDAARARSELGWAPHRDLETVVGDTVAWERRCGDAVAGVVMTAPASEVST